MYPDKKYTSFDLRLFQFALYLFTSFPLVFKAFHRSYFITLSLLILLYLGVKHFNKHDSNRLWIPFVQISPFLFYIISLLYTEDISYATHFLERVLVLYLFPLILYLNKDLLRNVGIQKTLRWYTIIISVLISYALLKIFLGDTFERAFTTPDANTYFILRVDLENSINIHPTYFSLLTSLALLFLQYFVKSRYLHWKNPLVVFQFVICLLGLLTASSKMILISTFLCSTIIWIQKGNAKRLLITSSTALLLLIILFTLIKPIRERFVELTTALTTRTIESSNPDSMRKAIYYSSFDLIKENFWLGTGIGDGQNELNKKYTLYGYSLALERSFNTHNQYLQVWVTAGFFAFLTFIVSLSFLLFVSIKKRDFLFCAITMLYVLCFITENILVRQVGAFTYTFFTTILLYHSMSTSKTFFSGKTGS